MRRDVLELREFYAGPLGAAAREALGVKLRERAHVLGRLDADARLRLARLVERHGGEVVELPLARVLVEPARLPRHLDTEQGPGVALQHGPLELEQQRGGQRGGAHEDLLACLDLQAVARDQVGEGRGIEPHGASTSGNHSARCSRRTSRTQRRSSPVAARNRARSSFCPA